MHIMQCLCTRIDMINEFVTWDSHQKDTNLKCFLAWLKGHRCLTTYIISLNYLTRIVPK